MPRWKALPEELDPEVEEFTDALRMLVDRGGLGIAAVADRTGYSRTSWERYLNGRLLPPKGAVIALAEVTGADPLHLTTLWELAERAWSRSEMRHDLTIEAMRVSQARQELGEFTAPPAAPPAPPALPGPYAAAAGIAAAPPAASAGTPGPPPAAPPGAASTAAPGPDGDAPAPRGGPASPGRAHRAVTFLAGAVGALLIAGAAVLLAQADPEDEARAPDRGPSSRAVGASPLPDGVGCHGPDCAGEDPETMGCGGRRAVTGRSVTVGEALLEVRFSEVCGAAWARVTGAAAGDRVTVSAGGGPARGAEVGRDPDAYTPMVAGRSAEDVKACVTPVKSRPVCTR
ncbi:XRE family transcriptional regulator [Streptomyces sp. MJP52]|uniref:helix-turn-helix domain-containing protein n=1 Tax=Streptomyces sp. MJP52 TaxID=2940555 RepID=UPI0024731762|nr:XRE family transcriptional regulator [Streptomyces sp. MJP52]MDH6225430.1 transcriptional regulator with XRE-family HTH domain [Streptomyces sp. MJP52]